MKTKIALAVTAALAAFSLSQLAEASDVLK